MLVKSSRQVEVAMLSSMCALEMCHVVLNRSQ